MATPPNFTDLQRKTASVALKFASVDAKLAGGAGAQVGRGVNLPTPTPTSTPPPPSSTPEPTGTPTVTPTITPEASPTPTPTKTPTITPSNTPEGTPAPTPTKTSTPTPTPTETTAPKPTWEFAIYGPITVPFVQEGLTVIADVLTECVFYYDTDDANVYGDNLLQIYVDNVSQFVCSFGSMRIGTPFAFEVAGDSRKFYGVFANTTYSFDTSDYPRQPDELPS